MRRWLRGGSGAFVSAFILTPRLWLGEDTSRPVLYSNWDGDDAESELRQSGHDLEIRHVSDKFQTKGAGLM